MPVYEYKCRKCAKVFEVVKNINDKKPEACTECGGRTTKLISLSTFHLKGSGWFKDGYGDGKHTKKGKT